MDSRTGCLRGPAFPLNSALPRVFWVTDSAVIGRPGFVERAARALEAGGVGCALQLRARGRAGGELWRLARRLRSVADSVGASLWINDRLDIALVVRADGVQLGSSSVPTSVARPLLGRACRLGRSVHSSSEALEAAREGADLVVLGNIYETDSHPDRRGLGLSAVREASRCDRPIVAIGGITPERAEEVVEAGAWGVAVRSGIWEVEDVEAAARGYRDALRRG